MTGGRESASPGGLEEPPPSREGLFFQFSGLHMEKINKLLDGALHVWGDPLLIPVVSRKWSCAGAVTALGGARNRM